MRQEEYRYIAGLSALFFIMGLVIAKQVPDSTLPMQIFIAYSFCGVPWGWKALSSPHHRPFVLHFSGWVMWNMLKFVLAYVIGFFITPFRLYRLFRP